MSEPSSPQRFAPIALWRVASRLMITLFNLFGEPQQLAFRQTFYARDYKLACNWLRTVEALFRKLLVIEASHYARHLTPPKPRAKRKRVTRWVTFYPDKPDDWRVSFRMDRGRPRPHPSIDQASAIAHTSRRAPRTPFHCAWPLAERFEALLRVHNDPTAYAKRLARRLYAAPQRIAEILREPTELQYRIDIEPYAEIAALLGIRQPVFSRANTS